MENYAEDAVLKRLICQYKQSGTNRLDTTGFSAFDNVILKQLMAKGIVISRNDITGAVSLSSEVLKNIK